MLTLGGPSCAGLWRGQFARRLWKAAGSALVSAWALAQYGACLHAALQATAHEDVGPYPVWIGAYTCQVRVPASQVEPVYTFACVQQRDRDAC